VFSEAMRLGEVNTVDDISTYDVFKGNHQKKPLWLGTVEGRTRAIDLMNRMAARLPGDYFVWNTITQQLVTEVHADAPVPIHAANPVANERQLI
jgi:hypothetical protein